MADTDGKMFVGEAGGTIEYLSFTKTYLNAEKKKRENLPHSTCLHRKKENRAERLRTDPELWLLRQCADLSSPRSKP